MARDKPSLPQCFNYSSLPNGKLGIYWYDSIPINGTGSTLSTIQLYVSYILYKLSVQVITYADTY